MPHSFSFFQMVDFSCKRTTTSFILCDSFLGRTITIRGVGSGGVKKTRRVSSTRRTRLSALRRIGIIIIVTLPSSSVYFVSKDVNFKYFNTSHHITKLNFVSLNTATLSQRGSRRRTTSQTGTRLRQRRGQRGRGRGRGRGRASSTRTGSGSGRRKQPTKEALDKELEEYMMSTPETAKKYLNEELDEYWAKAPESVTQTNKEVNGPNSENPSKKWKFEREK